MVYTRYIAYAYQFVRLFCIQGQVKEWGIDNFYPMPEYYCYIAAGFKDVETEEMICELLGKK